MSDEFIVIRQMTFENGRFIGQLNKAGNVTITLKESQYNREAPVDSVVLGDRNNLSICGPTPLIAAYDLARAIIEGEPAATTDPRSLYVLAACFLALSDDLRVATRDVLSQLSTAGRPDALT